MSGPTEILRPVICLAGPEGTLATQFVCCHWFDMKSGRSLLFRTSRRDGLQVFVGKHWHLLVPADIRVVRNPFFTDPSLPWDGDMQTEITVRWERENRDTAEFDLTLQSFHEHPRTWVRTQLGINILRFPRLVSTGVMALSMLRQHGVPC